MNLHATFDPGLGVFKHHFEQDPVVPGVMLLDHYVANGQGRAPCEIANLSRVRFHHFVRPGVLVEFTPQSSGEVRIGYAEKLCCTFDIDWEGRRALPQQIVVEGRMQRIKINALREPEYWFLPEEIEVDADRRLAVCYVDLHMLERRHPYLNEMARWRPLVLIECAGNLALALQHLVEPDDTSSRYVFARFDEIDYRVDYVSWASRQTIVTRVKRYGSMLVWDASLGDEVSTQIVIRGAVSRKGKAQ
jgi:hypothetical protein